jgi:hypothetical protein
MKTRIAKHASPWVSSVLPGATLCLSLPAHSPATALPKLKHQTAPVNHALHERTSYVPVSGPARP